MQAEKPKLGFQALQLLEVAVKNYDSCLRRTRGFNNSLTPFSYLERFQIFF